MWRSPSNENSTTSPFVFTKPEIEDSWRWNDSPSLALYLGAFLHGLQAAFIERDVQGFFLRDCHGSRRVTFGLPYPLSPGIDDLALSTLFEIAVKQGQGGRVFQRFRRRVAALFQSHDDM